MWLPECFSKRKFRLHLKISVVHRIPLLICKHSSLDTDCIQFLPF